MLSPVLAHGNPIVIDEDRRPVAMTAEDVQITVGPDHSLVSGTFSFRQQRDVWPEVADTHVRVRIPVLLSPQTADGYERKFGVPVVAVKGRNFPARIYKSFESMSDTTSLPKGWFLRDYEARIPLSLISEKFDIHVRYTQPNFPDGRAGYRPVDPPADPANAKITFKPVEGCKLRAPGAFAGLGPGKARLEFTPKHGELIAVRLKGQQAR